MTKKDEDTLDAQAAAADAPGENVDASAETVDAPAETEGFVPPAEGADHPDPYAHLGSNAPTGDEPDEEE